METAVIYARFSSHGQNEQSIEAQVRICKEFAENKGFKVINVYSDKARTGTNDARPAFQRMITDSESKAFKYIIVYMFDRFARNRRDSIMYKEMLKEKYGIRVISALEPIAEDEGGEFYEMFLEWNAEKYSKRLSKRVRDGLDTSVANGTFCGGTLIYGYKIRYESVPGKPNRFIKYVDIEEEEAFIVRYFFEHYAKGVTKKEIAETLNSKGYRFRGKLFTGKTFDRFLRNRKYTGEFEFGGRHCTNMYPAIVDKETFNLVQKRLDANRYFGGGVAKARITYLLTGKLICGECGTAMVSDGGTSKMGYEYHYYTCKKARTKRRCDKHREHKDLLERYVIDNVIDFLSDERNAQIAVDDALAFYEKRTDIDHLKSVNKKIADVKKEIEDQAEAFVKAKSALLQRTIEKKMEEYEILLSDLEYQKAQLELERGLQITKEDLLGFIADLLIGDRDDVEYQKMIVDHLVLQVIVSDEDTVIYLNIKGGKGIELVSFEETKNAIESIKNSGNSDIPTKKGVENFRMRDVLARQSKPKSNPRFRFYFLRI